MTFTSKPLSADTWPDFERLFAPGTGWAFCACMLYQRGCHLDARQFPTRSASRVENQRQKRELVDAGQAHGILVYDGDAPVAWCQFGPSGELPIAGRADKRIDRRLHPLAADVDWRITCFVTAVRHRHRGAAATALTAALEAISRAGGGTVEAYPTTRPEDADLAHQGTVGLFEAVGFAVHERPNAPYVVVRKQVPPG